VGKSGVLEHKWQYQSINQSVFISGSMPIEQAVKKEKKEKISETR